MKRHSRKTLILTRDEIRGLLSPKAAIDAVERAFAACGRGEAQMPPKIYLDLKHLGGDFRAMPSYIKGSGACAVKWVNVHPGNAAKGLPTVMGMIILSDPATGFPLAVMDGTYLTAVRTAAAGAVAAKYLARRDSRVLALVGCGAQASCQLEFLRTAFRLDQVNVWGPKVDERESFVRRMKRTREGMKSVETVQACVSDADIIVTITPSRKPLVKTAWVKPGAHINAIGADAPGKQELDSGLLKVSRIIIDDWAQASHSGEINVPVSKGLLSRKNVDALLGDIVCGRKPFRRRPGDITVFDSTGLAIQDAAVAQAVYKAAVKKRIGLRVKLF